MKTSSALRSVAVFLLLAFAAALLPAQNAPAPGATREDRRDKPYRITRGDVVSVAVLDEPYLNAPQRRVEGTGTIAIPYLQEFRVYGLTVLEAQDAIAKAYRDGRYLRNPVVSVTIETYAPRIVSISGKVNAQGRYEIPPDTEMTIKDLIFKAGGFSETARGTAVRLTRTKPDGTSRVFELDVESAIKGKGKTASGDAVFVLEPDDVIYVPERII